MRVDSLVITRHVVRIRRDDQASALSNLWSRLTTKKLPGGKCVGQEPVIPSRPYQRRRLNQATQLWWICVRQRVCVLGNVLTKNRTERLHVDGSDIVRLQSLFNERRALRTGHRTVSI